MKTVEGESGDSRAADGFKVFRKMFGRLPGESVEEIDGNRRLVAPCGAGERFKNGLFCGGASESAAEFRMKSLNADGEAVDAVFERGVEMCIIEIFHPGFPCDLRIICQGEGGADCGENAADVAGGEDSGRAAAEVDCVDGSADARSPVPDFPDEELCVIGDFLFCSCSRIEVAEVASASAEGNVEIDGAGRFNGGFDSRAPFLFRVFDGHGGKAHQSAPDGPCGR